MNGISVLTPPPPVHRPDMQISRNIIEAGMYRFLDRNIAELDAGTGVLLWAMRSWVATTTRHRCPTAALSGAFLHWGIADLLPDFDMTMRQLYVNGTAWLHFGPPHCDRVREDEARLIALFHAAVLAECPSARRMAAQLVEDDTLATFTLALHGAAQLLARTPLPRMNFRR